MVSVGFPLVTVGVSVGGEAGRCVLRGYGT